jgi:hypothetical protein
MLLLMLLSWLPWLLLGTAAFFLGWRAVRAVERRGIANAELVALRERVQLLEDTVAEQGQDVQRLTDDQRFTQRFLLERTQGEHRPAAGPPPAA